MSSTPNAKQLQIRRGRGSREFENEVTSNLKVLRRRSRQLVRARAGDFLYYFLEMQDVVVLRITIWNSHCVWKIRILFLKLSDLQRARREEIGASVRIPFCSRSVTFFPRNSILQNPGMQSEEQATENPTAAHYIRFVRGFESRIRCTVITGEVKNSRMLRRRGRFVCTARRSRVPGTFN